MSGSLKDQLKALGFAEKQLQPKKPARRNKKPAPRKADGEISLDQAWRQKARTEKDEAADKKQKKRAEDLRRRQVNAELQPIIDDAKLNDPKAELKRNFMYKGRIRSVLVTAEQLKLLNEGKVGLVFLRGSYFLLPPEIVEKVRGISPDHVPDLQAGEEEIDADHPVPDDLVW